MTHDERKNAIARVVAKTWSDPQYRQRLLAEPEKTLCDAGLHVPQGHKVVVVEDQPNVSHLVIPPKPAGISTEAALTNEFLVQIPCCALSTDETA